jgi:DNA-binding GntR family transcriptional regulator
MYWGSRPAQTSTMMSHSDLVAALEAHDPDLAAKAMREHLSASLSLVQASF